MVERIDIETFRQITRKELTPGNEFLSGWDPNPVIDHAIKPAVGKLRPWTKAGREYHNFYRNFYCTLIWVGKLWKIRKFEQSSWNIDNKVIRNITNKFHFLIECALENIDDSFYDDERNINPKDWLQNYDPYIISHYTAVDYFFQNITNNSIKNVLDFGSGIGRQAFQWFGLEGKGDVNFFSVDAIESLYLLQNEIYSLLFPNKLREYFYNPEVFCRIDVSKQDTNLYHLPTWRMDLLPSNSFDLIICVQVLNEINKETLEYLLAQFQRIAKENCILYIRDNEIGYTPAHNNRVGRLLLKLGFELLFRYSGMETRIEGKPRVWAFTGVENSAAHFNLKHRLARALSYPSGSYSLKLLMKSMITKIRDCGLPL